MLKIGKYRRPVLLRSLCAWVVVASVRAGKCYVWRSRACFRELYEPRRRARIEAAIALFGLRRGSVA